MARLLSAPTLLSRPAVAASPRARAPRRDPSPADSRPPVAVRRAPAGPIGMALLGALVAAALVGATAANHPVIAWLLAVELLQLPLAAWLAQRLRRARRERPALLERAVDASTQERRRIARDLHDGVVQGLVGVSYQLAAAAEWTREGSQVANAVAGAARETRLSIRDLRTLLADLYPPELEEVGLEAALAAALRAGARGRIDSRLALVPGLDLPGHAEELLLRVATESVRNVVSHAGAAHVWVSVSAPGGAAVLTVVDDGCGFDPSAPAPGGRGNHFGLRIVRELLREAGGALTVESAPGRGTSVRATVPLA